MGYSPGFLLKISRFCTLRNPPQIFTNNSRRSWKSIWKHLWGVSESLKRLWHLPKSAMFKTMGYSPGFLLKIGQFRTFANSPEISPISLTRSYKSIFKHLSSVSESLERFVALTQISHVQNHGQAFCWKSANFGLVRIHPKSLQTVSQEVINPFSSICEQFQSVWSDWWHLPKSAMFKTMGRLFAQNRPISDPWEFTRNLPKQSSKKLSGHFQTFMKRFRYFGAILCTYPNQPCSKPWAIAQAFCWKSTNFELLRIHPKSLQTVSQEVINPFSSICEQFQTVWSDWWHLPNSAMLKTMGYSPGFLLKIGQFRTLRNSPEIFPNSLASSFSSIFEAFKGVQVRFLCPYRNQPCSKPWAIAQAFCSKSANFRPLRIHPKSTQRVAREVTNHFRRV